MLRLILGFIIIVCSGVSNAQQIVWLNKEENVTNQDSAFYKKELSVSTEGVETTNIFRVFPYRILRVEMRKGGHPVGVWKKYKDGKVVDEEDFSNVVYGNERSEGVEYIDSALIVTGSLSEEKVLIYKDILNLLYNSIKYPDEAREKELSGNATVNFQLTTSGKLKLLSIAESSHELFDIAVVRTFNEGLYYKPYLENETPKNLYFSLKMRFVIPY